MNILLVNHYAGHPKMGMEFRPFYMASEWIKKGHNVEILASSYAHTRHGQPQVKGNFHREVIDGVPYTWLKTPAYKGNGIGRILNIFVFVWRALRYGKNDLKFKPDVIIASSTYPLDIWTCNKLSKHYQAKLIYEVHDLWPLSPIELGGVSKYNPLMLLFQWAENLGYRKAHEVVSILPCTLEHMKEHGLEPSKFHHIPNGVDVDSWQTSSNLPLGHQEKIEALKSQGKFLVAYTGAIGIANNLESLVNATGHLKENIEVLIMGNGPEKDQLEKLADKISIPNIHFLEAIDKSAIPYFLEQMDALYIGLAPQPLFRFGVSPNKLMDYMMSGRPIIYAINSGNHPVNEANCGIEVSSQNPEEIAKAINQIATMGSEQRETLGLNGHSYVQDHHDYKVLAEQFLEIMTD